jgi:lipoyl(octanoyl) transferase
MAVLQPHPPLAPERGANGGFLLEDLGVRDYDEVYQHQLETVARLKLAHLSLDRLIFVEHPDVYTLGRRSSQAETDQAFPTVSVERGGQITYHNPGQLVSYPILKLQDNERDLHKYLRRLEQVLIDVLNDFGVSGERRPGATGVWIEGKEKKIASIGVAVTSWVTYHGTALNVCNDLSGFAKIRPCGFPSEVMTSMAVELRDACPTMDEVKESYLRHFCRTFQRTLVV